MGQKLYCTVSGGLFSLVALAHLLRLVYGVSIEVDDYEIPMLASWIGFVVPGALAYWAFQMRRNASVAS